MNTADIGPVFGRGSIRIPTGEHVEVFREAAKPGERCRYRKRHLASNAGDLQAWTARERRILEQLGRVNGAAIARLAPVPDRSSLQTLDAGPTVDQWATRVLLSRSGVDVGNPFEDCASWWALARHCLLSLDKLHALGFVHLDLKADNICIPWAQPAKGDFPVPGQPIALRFQALAFIDVAFSLHPNVPIPGPLPLDRERHYEYQSQRLLEALEQGQRGDLSAAAALDWRCDLFSLAAMLWRYLPEQDKPAGSGWITKRRAQATAFVRLLVQTDTGPLPIPRPHAELIQLTELRLREPELAAALQADFVYEGELPEPSGEPTPQTRIFRQPPAAATVQASTGGLGRSLEASSLPPHQQPDLASAHLAQSPSSPSQGAPVASPAKVRPTQTEQLGGEAQMTDSPPPKKPRPHPPRSDSVLFLGAVALVSILAVAAWATFNSGRLTSPERGFAVADGSGGAATRMPRTAKGQPGSGLTPPTPLASPARPILPAEPVTVAQAAPGPAAGVADATDVPSSSSTATADRRLDAQSGAQALTNPPQGPRAHPVEEFLTSPKGQAAAGTEPPVIAGSFDGVARQLMEGPIPRLAEVAERQLAPVLAAAGEASDARSVSEVRAAARAARQAAGRPVLPVVVATQQARRLNEAARVAYWQRDNVPDALKLQTKAFGANPLDTEVAGNLAFLYLREDPAQPEASRELALHALTLRDNRFPAGRVEDWTTLAIASALTGRELAARNAWFVTLAVSNDLQRHCKAAVRAEGIYGDKLRSSVEAMLERARSTPGYGRCSSEPQQMASRSIKPRHDPISGRAQPRTDVNHDRVAKARAGEKPQPSFFTRAWSTVKRLFPL